MSNISTIYDTLLSRMLAIFPAKTRIPNAYDLPSNGNVFLRDSWGLKVSSSTSFEMEFNTYANDREFSVVLTKEVIKTDTQTDQIDTVSKSLLEDVNTLQKELINSYQLGIYSSIQLITLGSTTGITEVFATFEKFLTIEVSFNIKLSEDI
jgi:hypothetical protein